MSARASAARGDDGGPSVELRSDRDASPLQRGRALLLGAVALSALVGIGVFLDRAPESTLLLRAPLSADPVQESETFGVTVDPATLALELEAEAPIAVAFVHEDTGETIQLRLEPGRVLVDRIAAGRYALRLAPSAGALSAGSGGQLYVTEGVRSAGGFGLTAALLGVPLLLLLAAPRRRWLGAFAIWATLVLVGYAGYCATAMDVSAASTERRTAPPGSVRAGGGFDVQQPDFWVAP